MKKHGELCKWRKKVKKATAHLATGPTKWGMVGGKGQQLMSGWASAKQAMHDAVTRSADEQGLLDSLGIGGDIKWSEPDEYGTRTMIMPEGIMSLYPSDVNQKALQDAGQQSTITVVNESTTQNISSASSSSKQNNVGQTQQSIPISNIHGGVPRSV